MSVVENRSTAFWEAVMAHPAVHDNVTLGGSLDIASAVNNPRILPLAAKHGGFLFCELDGLGRTLELHTLFTPDGWGKEVHAAAKSAFQRVFDAGADLIVTHQVVTNPRSQPPRSFGFVPAGEFRMSMLGVEMRTWVLTRTAWDASPAKERASECQS